MYRLWNEARLHSNLKSFGNCVIVGSELISLALDAFSKRWVNNNIYITELLEGLKEIIVSTEAGLQEVFNT